MNIKKLIYFPIIVGILAFLIQIADQLLGPCMLTKDNSGFGWIAFQSWAVYFLAGGNIKGGIKAFLGYAVGIIASIVIMELGGLFGAFPLKLGVPVAVGLVAFTLIFLERTTWLSLIPAMFIGAGAFFAFMSYVPGATYGKAALTEMIYCVLGLIFGFATITIKGIVEKRMGKA
jgi:hypothetical protein